MPDDVIAEVVAYREAQERAAKAARKAFREAHKDSPDMLRKLRNAQAVAARVAREERIR